MQLHSAADGQEHEMSIVSYPMWLSSTSQVCADPSSVETHCKYNHWWPSQAYHCTFCPRVFRTAQALGGHMNIHRRERAFANDTGTHFHPRRDSPPNCFTTILSRSCSIPAPIGGQRSSLLGGRQQLLMNHAPPASINTMAPPTSCTENCYASRRIASTPPAPDYNVSTHLVTANFAHFPADMTYRVGWNGADGNPQVAKLDASHHLNNNISDPLSWLFSQLPPSGSVTTLQRQQQQQQQSRGSCRSNILMQKNLAKPYHRALAVRRSAGRPPPLSEPIPQTRREAEAEGSSNGEHEARSSQAEESLDLELRL